METGQTKLDVALVHYPVCNKNRETIGSAVTNLDLHDIARSGRTFGVDNYYIVTPYPDQQQLVQEILDHWLTGHGASYNRDRGEALAIVRICADLTALYAQVTEKWGQRPRIIATCARPQENTESYPRTRERLLAGEPILLLFGTGWGLISEVMQEVDATLPPIGGCEGYNHLPVRAAAAIILDRLVGKRD